MWYNTQNLLSRNSLYNFVILAKGVGKINLDSDFRIKEVNMYYNPQHLLSRNSLYNFIGLRKVLWKPI